MTDEHTEHPDTKTSTRARDASADKVYFTVTPRIVWAMSRTPYDLALWQTVKDIAGDSGECFITTPDLSILAMMSVGQCYDSRTYLLEQGLLIGEVRRDEGFPLPVWHLSIPDLWERSTAWAVKYRTIASRVEFKTAQKAEVQKARDAIRAAREAKKAAEVQNGTGTGEPEAVPTSGGRFSPREDSVIPKKCAKILS